MKHALPLLFIDQGQFKGTGRESNRSSGRAIVGVYTQQEYHSLNDPIRYLVFIFGLLEIFCCTLPDTTIPPIAA